MLSHTFSLLHTFALLLCLLKDHLFKGTEIKIEFLQLKPNLVES